MELDLLSLPWATLLTLASGYAAYFIANIGIRGHHKSIDVAFSVLVFGFFSYGFYYALREVEKKEILEASALTFLFALVLGALWQVFFRPLLGSVLRFFNVSFNDDLPSAWVGLLAARKASGRQLTVRLTDGTWLKCDDLQKFEDAPNGPCVLGTSGDLLMYVTHQQNADKDEFEDCHDVVKAEWGYEITYVPANQIARVDFRRVN